MTAVFIDFEQNPAENHSPLQDPAVIRFLSQTKRSFLSSDPLERHTQVKKSRLGLKTNKIDIHFSHNLVRTGPNQWHIIKNKKKGKGGFGTVNKSRMKLLVHENSIKLVKVRDVVKIQEPSKHISKSELLSMAKDEAQYQREHEVQVYEVVDAGDKVITVLEDCGKSLDKLFPLPESWDFHRRLAIAMRLGSEMLLLKQHDMVHRDLKPANICYKELGKDGFQIIFIDFGLSKTSTSSGNYEFAGTFLYMAPELRTSKSSSASDMYAFAAILGELFGAKDIFKYKKQAISVPEMLGMPYCFDGIFEGYKCSHIDSFLLEDFKKLLEDLCSSDPYQRPTVNHLNKFLITISLRQEEYLKYKQQVERQVVLLKRMDSLHQQITGFNQDDIPQTDCTGLMKKRREKIAKEIIERPRPKSHYAQAKYFSDKNLIADFSGTNCPFPSLDSSIEAIEKENNNLDQSLKQFNAFALKMKDETKWKVSNSSGVKEIISVLNSSLSIIQKLERLQAIGQEKTKAGFWNWYSRSSIFGKGRQNNVDRLYHLLANLDFKNSQFYLSREQLSNIQDFIERNHFLHGQLTQGSRDRMRREFT